jgi:ribose 5-phosphate isomerase B
MSFEQGWQNIETRIKSKWFIPHTGLGYFQLLFNEYMKGGNMIIAIGSDHGGYHLKNVIIQFLKTLGHEAHDLGAHSDEPSDYPDSALAVSQKVLLKKAERGILICGSGVGTCVAANKFPGIRAAICHDSFSAHQGVEDDNINILCLGARVIGSELAKDIVKIWLAAEFSGAERHVRRLEKVEQIENEFIRKS